MSDTENLAEIEAAFATAKQLYDAARRVLETALGRVYSDPQDAADALLSHVDEFGADHALKEYASNPHALGVVKKADTIPWKEVGSALSEEVPRVVDAQDRLDELAVRRDRLTDGRDQSVRTINIQGEDYILDGKTGTLERTQQDGKRVAVSLEPVAIEMSPSERFAQQTGSGKAQPPPDRPRERGR